MILDPAPPAPSAQGTLAKRPLAHLLAYAAERKLSGCLAFGHPDALAGAIVVAEGLPTKASFGGAGAQANVWEALAELRDDTPFAYFEGYDPLPADTRVETPLLEAVFRVLRRRPPLAHLDAAFARLGNAALVLDPALELPGLGLGPDGQAALLDLRQDPFTIEDARAISELRPRADVLVYGLLITKMAQVVANQTPSVIAPTSSSTDLSAAAAVAAAVVAAAPADPSSGELPDSSEAGAAVGRVKLTRASQKLVPMHEERAVVSSYDGRASVPPPASKRGTTTVRLPPAAPLPKEAMKSGTLTLPIPERRREIVERAATIDNQNYFEMLGIPEDLPIAQVQATFIALAKKWHPDRLPAELADVREACGRVFSRLSEATSTLCDEEQRKRYMRLLTEGGATPKDQETIATVVEAATSFQKAEVMLKRGDLAKAEELCALAVRLDAQPDYIALLAWIEAQKPHNQSPEATKRFEAMLTTAIEKSERCERAVFYRAVLRKRLGDLAGANADFRRATELNPRNVDAQREVRIYEMRRPSVPPERKPSLMGRLFKK